MLADQGAAILLREQDCGEHTLYDTVELQMQERDRRVNQMDCFRIG